jgi:hypothetical protein
MRDCDPTAVVVSGQRVKIVEAAIGNFGEVFTVQWQSG